MARFGGFDTAIIGLEGPSRDAGVRLPIGQARQPHGPQQPRDTRPTHRIALVDELLVDTRAPIGAPAGGMDGPDAYLQSGVVPRPLARPPGAGAQ